jgi:ABC-type oligopeptide transport system substrate-binding subunit
MAQFGWTASLEPPCSLFSSGEIPGPYPEFPKGWGGANAAGYTNPRYDAACADAQNSIYGSQEYTRAHQTAQALFAADLPAIPLYLHIEASAYRPDLCGVQKTSPLQSVLWNLEIFDILSECP